MMMRICRGAMQLYVSKVISLQAVDQFEGTAKSIA